MSSPPLSSRAIGRTASVPPPSGRLFLPCLLDKTAEWGHNKINLTLSVTYAGADLNKKVRKASGREFLAQRVPKEASRTKTGPTGFQARIRQIREYDTRRDPRQ